jgi:signal transduction histidine kinase
MNGDIFYSLYTLKLISSEFKKCYNNKQIVRNRYYIIFSIIILLIQLGLLIFFIKKYTEILLDFEEKKTIDPSNNSNEKNPLFSISNKFSKNFILIYFCLFITVINLILNFLTHTSCLIFAQINSLTYFTLNLVLLNIRSVFYIALQTDPNIFLFLESAFNTIFLLVICNEFLSIFISNFFIVFLFWVSSYLNSEFSIIQCLAYTGIILLSCVHAYHIDFHNKKLFYHKVRTEKDSKYVKNTLENILNGFAILKNGTLEYANKYFKTNLSFLTEKKIEFTDNKYLKEQYFNNKDSLKTIMYVDPETRKENSSQDQNSKAILNNPNFNLIKFPKEEPSTYSERFYSLSKNLLQGLDNINMDLSAENQSILSQTGLNLTSTLTLFSKQKSEGNNDLFNEFTYLGSKNFSIPNDYTQEEKLNYLDIFFRIAFDEKGETNYEFLFNNITDKKEIFLTKEEMKKKTMSLAKISHEFKNPVIIISELGEELLEEINKSNCNVQTVHDNLSLMKNLSAYILILVKDFEVISKKEASSNIDLICTWFDLRKEILNLHGIVLTLISKKYGGEVPPLDFTIKVDDDVPLEIYSDKFRLLQILINLVSNSIKFTQNGIITLSVIYNNSSVRFSVEDTGCGLSEEQAKNLFKEYALKSNQISNSSGSGLGLSIVKELCSKMGSRITFRHNQPNGSIFFFEIEQVNFKSLTK